MTFPTHRTYLHSAEGFSQKKPLRKGTLAFLLNLHAPRHSKNNPCARPMLACTSLVPYVGFSVSHGTAEAITYCGVTSAGKTVRCCHETLSGIVDEWRCHRFRYNPAQRGLFLPRPLKYRLPPRGIHPFTSATCDTERDGKVEDAKSHPSMTATSSLDEETISKGGTARIPALITSSIQHDTRPASPERISSWVVNCSVPSARPTAGSRTCQFSAKTQHLDGCDFESSPAGDRVGGGGGGGGVTSARLSSSWKFFDLAAFLLRPSR